MSNICSFFKVPYMPSPATRHARLVSDSHHLTASCRTISPVRNMPVREQAPGSQFRPVPAFLVIPTNPNLLCYEFLMGCLNICLIYNSILHSCINLRMPHCPTKFVWMYLFHVERFPQLPYPNLNSTYF